MEAAGFVGILIIIGIAVVAAIIIALIGLLLAKAWIKVARADEALVISGRKQRVQTTVM
ncbi:MAG TPA: flotillin family protein, partial [Microbacterium sp.]|nr:flotillin family protein [Microbacterium sp.]